jgi:hypothetical protein
VLATAPSLKKTGCTPVLVAKMPERITAQYFRGIWRAAAEGRAPHADAVNFSNVISRLTFYNE